MKKFLLILFCGTIMLGCKPTFPLYKGESKKYVIENLTEPDFKLLKQYLQKYSPDAIKDTIVIKYDFNKDYCWEMLDNKNDEYINSVLNNHQKIWANYRDSMTNVSAFEFRDPGHKFSKLVKWNSEIYIDSSRQLYNLLIKEKAACGISVMVLPDKSTIKTRTDPHFEVLFYNNEKLSQIIESKKASK